MRASPAAVDLNVVCTQPSPACSSLPTKNLVVPASMAGRSNESSDQFATTKSAVCL